MKFLDPSYIRWLEPEEARGKSATTAVTTRRLHVQIGERVYYIPKGFETDFASIPRILWALYAPTDPEFRRAAKLHDLLYKLRRLKAADSGPDLIIKSRIEADQLFLQGMEADGARLTARRVLYRGVRLGGWVAWNRYRRKEKL